MSKKNKTAVTLDPFQTWAHRWGRVGTIIVLLYIIAIPFGAPNFNIFDFGYTSKLEPPLATISLYLFLWF